MSPGSIWATVRARRRLVSTSSAAMTHFGRRRPSPVPGASTNRASRAPRYSLPSGSSIPTCDRSPARSARWIAGDGRASSASGVDLEPDAERDLAELAVDVLPLPDAEVVEVLAPAHPPERARAERLLLLPQVAPEVEVGHEVGVGVGEAAVVGGGRLLLAGRPLPRVLDRQRRREDEHLPHHAVAIGLDRPSGPAADRPGCGRAGGRAW